MKDNGVITPRYPFIGMVCGWSAVTLVFAAPVSRTLFALAGLLFVISWIAEGRWQEKVALLRSLPVTVPLLCLTAIVAIWVALSPAAPHHVINNLKVYSKLLLVLMLVYTFQNLKWRNKAWLAFVASMGIVLVSTYANVFINLPWSNTSNQGIGQDHSVFVEYVSQSVMTAVFLALCLQRAINSNKVATQLAWAAAAIVSVGSVLFLLQGRSGLVAVLVVIAVMAAAYTPRAWRWPAATCIFGMMFLLVISSPLMLQRVMTAFLEITTYEPFSQTSIGLRLDMWRLAIDQFLSHPWLGTGSGTYHQLAETHFGHCEYTCTHPHNQYIFFAMEYGVLGLVAFVWLLWRLGVTAYQSGQPERTVLYALVAVIAIDSLFNVPLWYRAQSYFFYAMLGLLIASNPSRSQPSPTGIMHTA